jgi:hypothetical protein
MPSRASHRLSNFFDDSGPVISKYLKWAEEYDKRMAQSWKEEADKVFLFVSVFLYPYFTPIKHSRGVDWFILGCRCKFDLCINPGRSTKPAVCFQLLPRKSPVARSIEATRNLHPTSI